MRYGKGTVVERIILRLSKYSQRLETEVATRTAQLINERQKSDKLLQNVLPGIIIEKLRRGDMIAAELFASTTVFFGDFEGFSDFAGSRQPVEVMHFISNATGILDVIIAKFDVFKVEGTGDSHMVASGLPTRHEKHAEEIVSMGCAMLEKFDVPWKLTGNLKFRGGAHSGACAAGIVGLSRPRYCLFGDTVNVASRMCSYGEGGRLHVSGETATLILDLMNDIDITPRGTIHVKGKGEMVSYWIDPLYIYEARTPYKP